MNTVQEPTSAEISRQMRRGFEQVMREVREKGLPLHYQDPEYPGEIIELSPDGSRRIVTLDEKNNFVVVREIPGIAA